MKMSFTRSLSDTSKPFFLCAALKYWKAAGQHLKDKLLAGYEFLVQNAVEGATLSESRTD